MKENEIYQSSVKVVFLLIFEIGSVFLMSFYFRQLIADFTGWRLIFFLTGLSLFLIFSFFASLLVRSFVWSSLSMGLAVAASFAVFYDYFSPILIFSGLIIFLIFLWGIKELRSAAEGSLKISFFRLAKVFLIKAGLGLAAMLTIFCYFLTPAENFPLSFKTFQILVKSNEKLVAIFIPDFRFEKSVKDNFVGFIEKQLAAKIPGFELLPLAAKTAAINEVIKNFPVNTGEPTDQSFFNFLQTKFNQTSKSVQKLIVIGLFICLFLIIQFLFIVLKWFFPIILFLIYLFLSAVNFINIRIESRDKEVVSI